MRTLPRYRAVGLALSIASVSLPALAQKTHEMKGKIQQIELAEKHIVVQETHGRKYRLPLAVGDASKIELPCGAGSLEQLHVGDDVTVSYAAGHEGRRRRRLVTRARPRPHGRGSPSRRRPRSRSRGDRRSRRSEGAPRGAARPRLERHLTQDAGR